MYDTHHVVTEPKTWTLCTKHDRAFQGTWNECPWCYPQPCPEKERKKLAKRIVDKWHEEERLNIHESSSVSAAETCLKAVSEVMDKTYSSWANGAVTLFYQDLKAKLREELL